MIRFLCLLGNPASHSLSPFMQNAALDNLELLDKYMYFALETDDLDKAMKLFRENSIYGANITIPYKERVFKYLDTKNISDEAKKIGAINTISKKDKVLYGHNTDWSGFLNCLNKHKKISTFKGKSALVVGSGGASKAVIYALYSIGVKIDVLSRTKTKPEEVCPKNPLAINRVINKMSDIGDVDMIINTTPLGMQGEHEDKTPVDKKYITEKMLCIDLIYNPFKTRFLKEAESKKAKIINGVDMLVYQGAESFKIWTKKHAPINVMRKAVLEKLNI